MSSYVGAKLRRLVVRRACGLCEYCLIHESDTHLGCHVDHVISEKHGGATEIDNLAHACAICNRAKGTDLGSINPQGIFCRFFNPRTDIWSQHFRLVGTRIVPLTEIGEVTVKIFGFNQPKRMSERRILVQDGRYPSAAAIRQMSGRLK